MLFTTPSNVSETTETHAARKILSREYNPPMGILIKAVPKMVEFLCHGKYINK